MKGKWKKKTAENRANAVFRAVCLVILLIMTRVCAEADTLPQEEAVKIPLRIVLRPEKEEGEPDPDLGDMIREQIAEQISELAGEADPALTDRLCACVFWTYDYSGGVIPPGDSRPAGESDIVLSFAEDPEYTFAGWTCPEEVQIPEEIFEDDIFEENVFEDDMFEENVFEENVFEEELWEEELPVDECPDEEEIYDEAWGTEEMSDEEWDPEVSPAEEEWDLEEISGEEIRDPELRSYLTTRPREEEPAGAEDEAAGTNEAAGAEEEPAAAAEKEAAEDEAEEFIDAEEIAEEFAQEEDFADDQEEEVSGQDAGPAPQAAAAGSYRQYQTVMTQPDAVPQEIAESIGEMIRGGDEENEESKENENEAEEAGPQVRLLRTDSSGKETDLTDMFREALSQADPEHIDWNTLLAPLPENDGTYVIRKTETGSEGKNDVRETAFSVNRFGSVYTYNDAVQALRGKTVKTVERPLIISEYNPDTLEKNSWKVTVTRDGQPLRPVLYTVSTARPGKDSRQDGGQNSEQGAGQNSEENGGQNTRREWSRCDYVVSAENFREDGVYRLAVSSRDAAGNTPEMNRYNGGEISFTVDGSPPELQAIRGLENPVVDGRKAEVLVTAFDTVGLARLSAFVDGKCMASSESFPDRHRADLTFSIAPGEEQHVRIVAEDTAGNVLDTDEKTTGKRYRFQPAFPFSRKITVRLPKPVPERSSGWKILIPMLLGCIAVSAAMLRHIFGAEKRRPAGTYRDSDPD